MTKPAVNTLSPIKGSAMQACGLFSMVYPVYSYSPGLVLRAARDVLLARRRSIHDDARACVAKLRPPLQVWGKEHIPVQCTAVLTVNHYHRPGFASQWIVLTVSAVTPLDIHWVMTAEWTRPGKWYRTIAEAASRVLLKRLARVYGFTSMPPMPPRPGDVEARAAAVRAVLGYLRSTKDPVLGLAPEGHDSPGGVLTRPAAGFGRFALLLAKAGLTFVPVGVYEADGGLHLRFGAGYRLSLSSDLSSEEKDRRAALIIMRNIAGLLPAHLRGEFA